VTGVQTCALPICPNDPAYDLEALRLHLDANVIAIIAVNFLGIGERLEQLRELISDLNLRTRVIEDNAQWFPSSVSEMEFQSDYVSFSFGRGKPMSLLGGGLLCSKAPIAIAASDFIEKLVPSPRLLWLKITAYNLLLTPQLYQLLNRNPLLSLGVTRYVPLEKIEHFDVYRRALLDENFTLHCARDNTVAQRYDSVVVNNGVQQLAANCAVRQRQLLRYPLLCRDEISRNKLLQQLSKAGLGASPMYASAIDRIEGVDGKVVVDSLGKYLKTNGSLPYNFYTKKLGG
jgi:dTDP-4-amino-4,6-dideoxygalactose transaminase